MRKLISFDWLILFSMSGLFIVGLLVIKSIVPELFLYQLSYGLLGLALFFVVSFIDWRIYIRYGWLFYIVILFLLSLTLLFGSISRGAARWLFVFQPAEIVKPLMIIYLAWYFESFDLNIKGVCYSLISIILPTLLIIVQPDLGSGIIMLVFCLSILLAAGIKIRYVLGGGAVFFASLPFLWNFLHKYQKQRVLTFLNPFSDPLHSGYNVIQSITAIGSGQFSGWGLGRGPQSHLRFLPENHTDFIFASLAEELGFIGALFLLILFAILCFRILTVASLAKRKAALLISIGVFSLIFGQLFINIGMNLGILPVTGITLPLISYGGNSIISVMVCLGLVESVARFMKDNEVKYRL